MSMTQDLTCGKNADDLATGRYHLWARATPGALHLTQGSAAFYSSSKQPQVRRCFLDQSILRPGESAAVAFSSLPNGVFPAALLPPMMFSTFKQLVLKTAAKAVFLTA